MLVLIVIEWLFCEERYSRQRQNWLRMLRPGLNKKGRLFQLYSTLSSEAGKKTLEGVTTPGDKNQKSKDIKKYYNTCDS